MHVRCFWLNLKMIKVSSHESCSDSLSWHNTSIHSIFWCLSHLLSGHKPGICQKPSTFISNIIWYCTNLWLTGSFFPCSRILNATLEFSNFLDIAAVHKELSFLASRARACFTVLGHSMPNLCLLFQYWVCCFIMLATILFFLSTWLTHQLKAVSWSILLCNRKFNFLLWMK